MTIKSDSAYNICAQQFAAFQSMNHFILEQTGKIMAQQWNPTAFDTTDIKWMEISGLDAMVPFPIALSQIGGNITTLSITKSNEKIHITKLGFEKFSNLAVFILIDVSIEKVDDDAFFYLENTLGVLTLKYTSLENFPISITNLKKLTWLDLTNNKIDKIPKEFHNGNLKFLDQIYLSNNYLGADTDKGSLDFLSPQVLTLDLSNNNISSIPRKM